MVYIRDVAIMRLFPSVLDSNRLHPNDWDSLTVAQRRTLITGPTRRIMRREEGQTTMLGDTTGDESTSKHGTGYVEMNVDETCSNERVWQENEGSETLSESEMRFGSSLPI
jgi:hypothetical protein